LPKYVTIAMFSENGLLRRTVVGLLPRHSHRYTQTFHRRTGLLLPI